jgi:hypothetical protein
MLLLGRGGGRFDLLQLRGADRRTCGGGAKAATAKRTFLRFPEHCPSLVLGDEREAMRRLPDHPEPFMVISDCRGSFAIKESNPNPDTRSSNTP